MSRIAKTADNIVSIPKSVSVTAKGYVYWNATTTWVDKANGTGKRADHKKECIGVVLCPGGDWKKDRRMYANSAYYRLFPADKSSSEKTPGGNASSACREYPQRFDCISAGLYAAVSKIADHSIKYFNTAISRSSRPSVLEFIVLPFCLKQFSNNKLLVMTTHSQSSYPRNEI
jgi:hypothetical protein